MNTIFKYKYWESKLRVEKYYDGNIALCLEGSDDGEPIATLTRNFPEYIQPKSNLVALDVNNCGNEIIQLLIDNEVIEPTMLLSIPSGYCDYPVYKLKT